MRSFVFIAVLLLLPMGGRTASAASPVATEAEWKEIDDVFSPANRMGDQSPWSVVQKATWWEAAYRKELTSTVEFFDAHPNDPRRWTVVNWAAGKHPAFATGFALRADGKEADPIAIDAVAKAAWQKKLAELLDALVASPDATDVDRARGDFERLRSFMAQLRTVAPNERLSLLTEVRRRFDQQIARYGTVWDGPRAAVGLQTVFYRVELRDSMTDAPELVRLELRYLSQSSHPYVAAEAEFGLFQEKYFAALKAPVAERREAVKKTLPDFDAILARHIGVMANGVTSSLVLYYVDNFTQTVGMFNAPQLPDVLGHLAESPLPVVRERASEKLAKVQKQAAVMGRVLELSFTAADGREVDIKNLRGKVVLIDFWATWCGPCIAELPNVKRVYAAYRDRGFAVIGISLENGKLLPKDTASQTAAKLSAAKQVLIDFTAKEQMPWPQYFDGKYWKNDYVLRWGIASIPAMFLLDQDGKVVSTNARGPKLEAEVKRLLKL